jgi:hypothetical protein
MMKRFLVPAIASMILLGGSTGSQAGQETHDTRSIRHKVADAYGVHAFEEVERLSFTFNVRSGERHVRRSWTWWPHENRVRYDGGTWRDNEPFEYAKGELEVDSTETMVAVDQRFINDTYWLLFAYHLEWDISSTVTDEGMAPVPIGEGEARKVVIDYPDVGGYTPGDIYELYVGPDYRALAWVFRPGGSEEKRYAYTWGDEQRFGGVTFATEFTGADGNTRIWMSDITVVFADE